MRQAKHSIIIAVLLMGTLVLPKVCFAFGNQGLQLKFSLDKPVTITVSGKVTDKETGQPIRDALVRGHVVVWRHQGPELFEKSPYQEVRTFSNGQYQLQFTTQLTTTGTMKGRDGLNISVSSPGYGPFATDSKLEVTPNNTVFKDIDFELSPGTLVRGKVVDDEGKPMSNVIVRALNNWNGNWMFFGSLGETFTDKVGNFELWVNKEQLGNSPWMEIYKQRYGENYLLDFLDKEDLGTITLQRGGSIQGKIVDINGQGVEGCEVLVNRYSNSRFYDRVKTNRDGQYTLKGLPGNYSDFTREKASLSGSTMPETSFNNVRVYARLDPKMSLADAPQYVIEPKNGTTVNGPRLTVQSGTSVSGSVTDTKNTFGLGGLLLMVDYNRGQIVETTPDGSFYLPYISPGKHRLTAYLPFGKKYIQSIGLREIEVEAGKSLENIQIPLLPLSELKVRFLDINNNPLPNIISQSLYSKNINRLAFNGSPSDRDGWSKIYLSSDRVHYITGFDPTGKLITEGLEMIDPIADQVLSDTRILMIPPASIRGRVTNENMEPISNAVINCVLDYADGIQSESLVKTNAGGNFEINQLPSGIINLSMVFDTFQYPNVMGSSFELKPGQIRDISDIVLSNGIDQNLLIREKHANVMDHPEEVIQAARQLFENIRDADYDYFLTSTERWHEFPTVGYYMAHSGHGNLTKWICETFKENPIVNIQLGQVFVDPEIIIIDRNDLPTVPYQLTLENGDILKGNLPFKFDFDGGKPHWHGLEGIDWHLKH